MKKTILASITSAILLSALAACNSEIVEPFSSIPAIDSSEWAIDPNDYGMTAEQFIRAESLHFMSGMSKRNGVNNFFHFTSLAMAKDKWVVSPNNDVIYSMAIVDASQGFTLTIPETGSRFITAQIVSEEHMSRQLVGGGIYKFNAGDFNGDHVAIGIRVGTDATPQDVTYIVEKLQPQMKVNAVTSAEVSNYDETTMLKVRKALISEYDKLENTFGVMSSDIGYVTDWEKFTYTTAGAWGLSEDKYAMYIPYNLNGAKSDICYTATYTQPKVDQFWSITAYNNQKYLMSNESNIINTGNVKLNDDGSFTVHFGSKEACNGVDDIKNFILTTENDWGFLMRAYEADVESFNQYSLPEVKPINTTLNNASGIDVSKVTMENYVIAESDWYFNGVQNKVGVNVWMHDEPVSKDNQQVIRSNRDVVYSIAIVDVSEGATFTVPKSNEFQAIHIIDEAHLFHQVVLNGETLEVNADDIEGEYVYLLARTRDSGDVLDTKARQSELTFNAVAKRPYQAKGFSEKEVVAFREELVRQVNTGEQPIAGHDAFGKTIDDVNPHNYLYAAAYGWGGLPMTTAQYVPLQVTSEQCQTWTLPKPALNWANNGFMSATFYGADGWIKVDDFYIPHTAMKDNGDTLSFTTNCRSGDGNATVEKGGNLLIRMYLPIDAWDVKKVADSMYLVKGVTVKA